MIALCGCAFQSTRPSRGATNFTRPLFGRSYISIHAPLAGRDLGVTVTAYPQSVFQSTRPSRGATWRFPMRGGGTRHFNPRAPRGARPISFKGGEEYILFQSTRPSRGATVLPRLRQPAVGISIHAPLAGRDRGQRRPCAGHHDFNPRAPRGARPVHSPAMVWKAKFQSTRPSRGATLRDFLVRVARLISIHAPLAGRDSASQNKTQ